MKHSLWCRLIMAMAHRRVCTCGASKTPTKDQLRNRQIRAIENRARRERTRK